MGNQFMKVVKTNNVSKQYYGQTLNLEKGKTYTSSSYVKTLEMTSTNGGGVGLFVLYQDNVGNWKTVDTAENLTARLAENGA